MRKTQTGVVVSDKMTNTAVVVVALWRTHRILGKRFQRHHRFLAENPGNQYKAGEKVVIAESRPLSRHKHWTIIGRAGEIVEKPVKKGKKGV